MRNYEKYAEEIKDYKGNRFCADFIVKHIVKTSDCITMDCDACKLRQMLWLLEEYEEQLDQFRKDVKGDNYKSIRDNKKIHFWMNSGTIKVSTINSFKGWESEVVFLILEPRYNMTTTFNLSFDELLYTGLTRCRRNLFVINYGNEEYDEKIRPLIESFK